MYLLHRIKYGRGRKATGIQQVEREPELVYHRAVFARRHLTQLSNGVSFIHFDEASYSVMAVMAKRGDRCW